MNVAAAIFGCASTSLLPEERDFFRDVNPYGFILFARNCVSSEQIRNLIDELYSISGFARLPILIDQEGGRVARLKPPNWPEFPAAARLAKAEGDSRRAVYLNARLIAQELRSLGITVNCAPVADIRQEGAHEVIGDRAYGNDPATVIAHARSMANGLMDGGIIPVLKHIPGHGRASLDSHLDLPVVNTPLAELEATDFMPFKALNDLPMAMTAHVLYSAIDEENMVTTSSRAISIIRNEIGFEGLLMSDDLSMKAMRGDFCERTKKTLAAGCDVVLHCNGNMSEMLEIAKELPILSGNSEQRAKKAMKLPLTETVFDANEARKELAEMLKS